jgi:hypothetical protein
MESAAQGGIAPRGRFYVRLVDIFVEDAWEAP